MADVTELSNDIKTATAIAKAQTDAAVDVNFAHIRAGYGVGNAEVAEILSAAQTRAFATQINANTRAAGDYFLGSLDANVAIAEATIGGFANLEVMQSRVATISGNAATQALAVAQETRAQVQQIAGTAATGVATAGQLAAIEADESAQSAASHALQSSTSSQAQANATRQEAVVRASATTTVATLQSGSGTGEATIRAQGARDEASLQASTTATEVSLSVATIGALAATDAAGAAEEADVRFKSLLDLAYLRAWATRTISAARVAEQDSATASEVAEINRLADIHAKADIRGADVRHDSAVYAANQDLVATKDAADKRAATDRYRAAQGLLGTTDGADRQYQSTAYSSDKERAGRSATATSSAAANVYADDQQYATVTAHEASETARLRRKLAYADAKFALIWPYAVVSAPGSAVTPGFPVPEPFVSTRVVFTPAEVQRQVNSAFAAGDAQAQTALREVQGDVAGRGFGGGTPYLEAFRLGIFGKSIADTGRAITQARFSAASANADEVLKAQGTRNDRFMLQQQAVVQAERNRLARQVGVIEAAASLSSGG